MRISKARKKFILFLDYMKVSNWRFIFYPVMGILSIPLAAVVTILGALFLILSAPYKLGESFVREFLE